ncbi:hypothetical protein ANN_26542 [Periplaneta americana]|uniref:YqaJ viral recombinase domain-containing protein n=1 Tax=Periplaneta americana TaxID=6978 RepID=A0ABQ8RYI1_PERAM|nr:hypothetical protein ANN_26542 [Periplaneta americana]
MGGVTVGGRRIKCVRFSDDMAFLPEEEVILRIILLELNDSCEQYRKTMVIGRKLKKLLVKIPNESLTLLGREFQSRGTATVKDDEYEDVWWEGMDNIEECCDRVSRLWWVDNFENEAQNRQEWRNAICEREGEDSGFFYDLLDGARTTFRGMTLSRSKSGIKKSPIDTDALKKAVEAVTDLPGKKSKSNKPDLVYDSKYNSNMIVRFYNYISTYIPCVPTYKSVCSKLDVELKSSCHSLCLSFPEDFTKATIRNLLKELRGREYESWKTLSGRGKGVEMYSEVTAANSWIANKKGLSTSELISSLKMTANLTAVRSDPGRSLDGTRCRYGFPEIETLAHVLGFCEQGLLLTNSRHHLVRSKIAAALRNKGWIVEEEISFLAENWSTRRVDILAYNADTKQGIIVDPTIRFEVECHQSAEVHLEKKSIYEPTVNYFKLKYALIHVKLFGLLIGARGTIPAFFEEFRLQFALPTSLRDGVVIIDEEAKQNYQVEISNRFATLESSDEVEKELDVNSVWENIRDSIKIAAEQSIGYYETKRKKPWFDEDCCMVVERRKQAKLKFLQDPVEEKRDNYFNERREASRTLRNKKRGYLKEKLNEVETNSKNKNIRDLYKGIKEFKNGYQPRLNVIKDENGDLLADSPSILNRWKNYFAQLLNVHRPNRNDRDEIEIQTAEPFIPEPTLSEVEIAIENLKKYKSPGIDQIPAELIQEGGSAFIAKFINLYLLFGKRKLYQNNGRSP